MNQPEKGLEYVLNNLKNLNTDDELDKMEYELERTIDCLEGNPADSFINQFYEYLGEEQAQYITENGHLYEVGCTRDMNGDFDVTVKLKVAGSIPP